MGRLNQCEICLEPRMPSLPAPVVLASSSSPLQPGRAVPQPRAPRSPEWSPGLRGTVLVLQSFPWSLLFCSDVLYNGMFRFNTLHGSFRDCWSCFFFPKIKVIQTSCTCRLKRCKPLALCERSTRSMLMGSLLELHTWKFTNTEINLQMCYLAACWQVLLY